MTADRFNSDMRGTSPEGRGIGASDRGPAAPGHSSDPSPTAGMSDKDFLGLARSLLEHDPASLAFVTLAEELCARRLWAEAAEIVRRGLGYHPRHFRGRVLLGWSLWELGESEEAQRHLNEARKELERNAIVYRLLAEAAEKRGDSALAWRLMHIYQSLQNGYYDQTAAPQVTPEMPALPEVPVGDLEAAAEEMIEEVDEAGEEEAAPLVGLLTSLLGEYEKRQVRDFPMLRIFTDVDRKMIQKIVGAGAS